MTPNFDPVPESEIWALSPPGVSIHASRIAGKGGDARSFAEAPQADNAVELLASLRPRAILYAFTSSSYALGAEADDSLRVRLETRARANISRVCSRSRRSRPDCKRSDGCATASMEKRPRDPRRSMTSRSRLSAVTIGGERRRKACIWASRPWTKVDESRLVPVSF